MCTVITYKDTKKKKFEKLSFYFNLIRTRLHYY